MVQLTSDYLDNLPAGARETTSTLRGTVVDRSTIDGHETVTVLWAGDYAPVVILAKYIQQEG